MNPTTVTKQPEPSGDPSTTAGSCRVGGEFRSIATSWRSIVTNIQLRSDIRAAYQTAAQRLDQDATATESHPCPCKHNLRTSGHGQHVADDLTRVAADIATAVGDH